MSQSQFVPGTSPGERDVQNVGHVYGNSWGIFVFAQLPYLSGGIDEDGEPRWYYFEDRVRVETAVDLLKAEARRQGATHLIDLKSDWISEWSAPTLIFWIVETEASATALKVTGEAPPGALPL